jgi:hypothetical protein
VKYPRILSCVSYNPILENLIELITSELIILETSSLVHIILPITKWIEIKTNPKCKLIQRVTIEELD